MLPLRFSAAPLVVVTISLAAQAVFAANFYPSYSDRRTSPPTIVPMVFPIEGKATWTDTFAPNGEGGKRSHHGLDLMAPKMTPLVASFDGEVELKRATKPGGGNMLWLRNDEGCLAVYIHINNDTPGTDDGLGSEEYAFAPGLRTGDQVTAGQHIAYVGDSGNAEGGAPHLHFELYGPEGWINPTPSLLLAQSESEEGVEAREVAQAVALRHSSHTLGVRRISTRGVTGGSRRLGAVRRSLANRRKPVVRVASTKSSRRVTIVKSRRSSPRRVRG